MNPSAGVNRLALTVKTSLPSPFLWSMSISAAQSVANSRPQARRSSREQLPCEYVGGGETHEPRREKSGKKAVKLQARRLSSEQLPCTSVGAGQAKRFREDRVTGQGTVKRLQAHRSSREQLPCTSVGTGGTQLFVEDRSGQGTVRPQAAREGGSRIQHRLDSAHAVTH